MMTKVIRDPDAGVSRKQAKEWDVWQHSREPVVKLFELFSHGPATHSPTPNRKLPVRFVSA